MGQSYGLTLDAWQNDVLHDWMGRDRHGDWTSTICGLAVPRQNGKNGVIEVRQLFGMIQFGERFLHTAHEVKTARKAFLRIASFFENRRQYPELAELVKEIRRTNGQEAVVLDNGGSVEFVARSKGSARGFTVDTLVIDEAQEFSEEAQEALQPTISAAPSGDPQRIYTGTPPGPKANGDIWRGLHQAGESGKTARMAWTDFGCVGEMPDVEDHDGWFRHNPALGGRLKLRTIEDERTTFATNIEGFARERLGWWGDEDAAGGVFGAGAWEACRDTESQVAAGLCYGVATSIDREWTTIACAGRRADGLTHVEVVDRRPGSRWAVKRTGELVRAHGASVVVIDGGGPTSALQGALDDELANLLVLDTKDVLDACSQASDDVRDGQWRHIGQQELDDAVRWAVKRDVGDRYAWGRRKSAGDISPLESVTLAAACAGQSGTFNIW